MMIKNLEIENFKSIKGLKLDCKKINIFIGKPNTGKSNILEGVGIFSIPFYGDIKEFIRFENMANLFYDQEIDKELQITVDDSIFCDIKFENGNFIVVGNSKHENHPFHFNIAFNYSTNERPKQQSYSGISPFKFYKFAIIDIFPREQFDFLLPPKGENLLQLLLTKKEFKKVMTDIFSEYGMRIVLKPQDKKIEVQKEVDDVVIAYPYSLVSDTLQRIVFYLAAIDTNKDSIIILEEPEAHSFPYYTKFLAERISFDKTNQYFIATHNPYFLQSILQKAPKDDIGIFITYFEDYQTKIKLLNEQELVEVIDLGGSVFFNLDKFLESK